MPKGGVACEHPPSAARVAIPFVPPSLPLPALPAAVLHPFTTSDPQQIYATLVLHVRRLSESHLAACPAPPAPPARRAAPPQGDPPVPAQRQGRHPPPDPQGALLEALPRDPGGDGRAAALERAGARAVGWWQPCVARPVRSRQPGSPCLAVAGPACGWCCGPPGVPPAPDQALPGPRCSVQGILALQEAAEAYLVGLMEDAQVCGCWVCGCWGFVGAGWWVGTDGSIARVGAVAVSGGELLFEDEEADHGLLRGPEPILRRRVSARSAAPLCRPLPPAHHSCAPTTPAACPCPSLRPRLPRVPPLPRPSLPSPSPPHRSCAPSTPSG